MPYITAPSFSRRFFMLSLAGGSAALLRSAAPGMHWALLSDTHIPADPGNGHRGFKPQENFKAVVPQVIATKPDGALICGDVARLEGLPADYETVSSLVAPITAAMPLAMALGNHDDRKNFLAALGAKQQNVQPVRGKHVLIVESTVARFVVLDSLIQPNLTPGLLGKAQRTWLDNYLDSASNLPTLLFVHHTLDDGDGSLLDAPRLFETVKRHRGVKAIVFGHSHRYSYEEWEGVHLVNLPAVGYNFADNEPVGWVDANITKESGTFTLNALAGNRERHGKSVSLTWRT